MLQRFQAFFRRVVEHVENREVPFPQHLLLYASLLAVRLGLEFWSSNKLFTLGDVLHIGLWFTLVVLAFMVLLKVFSGERMIKVARLVITFFSIALIAPILDLILSGGKGFEMNYLSLDPRRPDFGWQVAFSYLTLGGSSLHRGATPGIRIEIALLVLAAFNYIYNKRKRILPAAVGAWAVYSFLFLTGAIPLLVSQLMRRLGLAFTQDDHSTELLFLAADAALLLCAGALHLGKGAWQTFRRMPWPQMALGLAVMAMAFSKARIDYLDNWQLTPTSLIHWPLAVLMVMLAGAATTQALQNGGKRVMGIAWVLVVGMGALISVKVCFTAAVAMGLLLMRDHPPLLLKRAPLLGSLMAALVYPAIGFVGYALGNAPMIGFPKAWLLQFLLVGFGLALHEEGRRELAVSWVRDWPRPWQVVWKVVAIGFTLGGLGLAASSSKGGAQTLAVIAATGVALTALPWLRKAYRPAWLWWLVALAVMLTA